MDVSRAAGHPGVGRRRVALDALKARRVIASLGKDARKSMQYVFLDVSCWMSLRNDCTGSSALELAALRNAQAGAQPIEQQAASWTAAGSLITVFPVIWPFHALLEP